MLYIDDETLQPEGNTIRLYYNKRHDEVNADDDAIQNNVDTTWLAWAATYYFLRTRRSILGTATRESMLLGKLKINSRSFQGCLSTANWNAMLILRGGNG